MLPSKVYRRSLLLFLLVYLSTRAMCKIFDPSKLRNDLFGFVNNVTNFMAMEEAFERARGEYTEVNSTNLLEGFVKKVEHLFHEKKIIVERLKRTAEAAHVPWNGGEVVEIEQDEMNNTVNYGDQNMRDSVTGNETFGIVPTFSLNVEVNMNSSFVHVPTNVHAKSNRLLSVAKWTHQLDDAFKDNFFNQSKEDLLYQYYGDSTGFMRVFPGNSNNMTDEEDHVDLYDCRRRPWYVQGASSPKNIVILIDLSGSMVGQKVGIAKIATAALIDSLEQNDFFNVIAINKDVIYMEDCLKDYNILLQATKKNKERMKMAVQTLPDPAHEMQHFRGLEAAFRLLNSEVDIRYNRTYSGCNSAIVFITDGIEGDGKEESARLKQINVGGNTRVFTYLVGREKSPNKDVLRVLACGNKGYLYKLETIGNVWNTILEYLNVMSRPLIVQKTEQKVRFSPAYLDSTGLGMIMSVSAPVFSIAADRFTGVVGTDISIDTINDFAPHDQLGTFGHMFIITNNGFILYHPKLRLQVGKSLPSPPNILFEDLEDAVEPENIIRVKQEMIDRIDDINNPNNTFPVYYAYDSNRKLSILNATYNYQNVTGTEFTAGITLSDSQLYHFNFDVDSEEEGDDERNELLIEGIKALDAPVANMSIPNITVTNWTYVQVSPWNYLNITAVAQEETPYSIKAYPTAAEIYEYLQDTETWDDLSNMVPTNFSTQLLKNMLMSAAIAVTNVLPKWVPEEIDADTYQSLFVATAAGYSRFFTFSNTTDAYGRDVLNLPIFQHAIANPETKMIFSAPYNDEENRPSEMWITAVAPVRRSGQIIAVTGMIFDAKIMLEHFENATQPGLAGFKDPQHKCNKNMTDICALLDMNGYIIASNQGDEFVGSFIGEQARGIVELLVNLKVLKGINLTDTQDDCKRNDPRYSYANILLTPAKLFLNTAAAILKFMMRLGMHFIMLLYSVFRDLGVESEYIPNIRTSCDRVMQYYFFQRNNIPIHKNVPAKKRSIRCQKGHWCYLKVNYLQLVPDTNLIFLKISIHYRCVSMCRDHKLRLARLRTDFDEFCKNTSFVKQKYRRQPSTCFNGTIPQTRRRRRRRRRRKVKKRTYACSRSDRINCVSSVLTLSVVVALLLLLDYQFFQPVSF